MDWYCLAKDFAGSLATVSAAGSAACIIWVFASLHKVRCEMLTMCLFGSLREIERRLDEVGENRISEIGALHERKS
jgi:hypothetical protein